MTAEEFWTLVDKDGECWLWLAHLDDAGYGRVQFRGKVYGAHRLAWELHTGEAPGKLWVLHRCDTPPCVRPEHLFLGTCLDNIRDRDSKGRTASGSRNGMVLHPEATLKGERNPQAKLDVVTVAHLRALYQSGLPIKVVARLMGIPATTARDAIRGIRWAQGGLS